MKKLSILGATGSIGRNTLEVVRGLKENFEVVALAAGENIRLLAEQIEEFKPKLAVVKNEERATGLKDLVSSQHLDISFADEGLVKAATIPETDLVVVATSGSVGLTPTLRAIEAGKDIALANKESLVMGGELIMAKASERGVKLLPIDSEHSALFQCLEERRKEEVKRIILTASGGPFFKLDPSQLSKVTVEEALKHPSWKMGKKVTIDSATFMNKGLEVIEAHFLFGFPKEKIEVVIHPQSIVHSLVEFIDGSIIGELNLPDMRVPIQYALTYPERMPNHFPKLDLRKGINLSFLPADFAKFPSLKLSYHALEEGGTMRTVLAAADEVAVEYFLSRKITFDKMPLVVEKTMAKHKKKQILSLETVLEAERWAKEEAKKIAKELSSTGE
jgi:1-deoxy-D-xylulose-5-phosphate reductoisomerase